MLDGAMIVWFALTLASVLFVVGDSVWNGVTSWVQRAAWILVTLYTGPVGLVMYLLACRRPFPGGHDRFTAATWKQGLNSEMHCLAGDATGIVIAASIVPTFALANGWDITIEYLAGFVSGLFIFQALMMLPMYGGDYLKAVRNTIFAETVSMNFVMAGMIPTMVFLAHLWPGSDSPLAPAFWFRMSLATVVGGVLAFPINYWLVARHLKHGCMTLPGADGPAPALGHRSPESDPHAGHAVHAEHADHAGHTGHAGHADHAGHTAHAGQAHAGHLEHAARASHGGHNGQGGQGSQGGASSGGGAGHVAHAMEMTVLPTATALLIVAGSFVVLFAAIAAVTLWVPIRF